MDFVFSLPPDAAGNTGAVVFVDRLSKMAHIAVVLDTIVGEGTATLFLDRVVRQHDLPEAVVSERDPRFTAKFWTSIFAVLGTRLSMSTADHPQTNGQTEHVNRVVEDVLRSICAETPKRWSAMLPLVAFALNNAVHASTGYTPFYVCLEEEPSPQRAVPRGQSQDSDLAEPLAGRPAGQSDHDGNPIVPRNLDPVQPLVQRVNLIVTAIDTLMNVLDETPKLTQTLRESSHHARPRQRPLRQRGVRLPCCSMTKGITTIMWNVF
ncbi:unnamed protein product [Phytophthora fragariaefolia]|uniref:Unnamed protein product n=1 Tax=Phytophthora fragariaefolia TaxID=1490495 RepID=A0A9W6X229_9STRA|nr:unnamed protein product [Phytophthora fragariaefolia]